MPKKNRDEHNRLRKRIIAFRMSPEEEAELNERIKLMGYRTKQDYLIDAVLHNEVRAVGNPLMLVQFRHVLARIEEELIRISDQSEMDEEIFTPIRSIREILIAFENGKAADTSNVLIKKKELDRMLHRYDTWPPNSGHARDYEIDNNNESQEENENGDK